VDAVQSQWDVPEELEDYFAVNANYFLENPRDNYSLAPDREPHQIPPGSTLRVAIVGTGPAGCYAAAELSAIDGVEVSLFDRLPTPFGLVRAGVAPDHAKTKTITESFSRVLGRSNVRCYFNVEVARDVGVDELLEHHHAVIWAGGATSDRRLNVPGEDLDGCLPAREFVAWYNGHPEHSDRTFNLRATTAVVIGNGNVALDVARILAQPTQALRGTDIADHALTALENSAVTKAIVTARRGPEHAAYTSGELASLMRTPGVQVTAKRAETQHVADLTDRSSVLIRSLPEATEQDGGITFRFGLVPQAIVGNESVKQVIFQNAEGDVEIITTSLVLKAIGYRGREVPSLPFDETLGTLPNVAGRVIDPQSGDALVGVYCSGWIKRGPTGTIGTNRVDSAETVEALLEDFAASRLARPTTEWDEFDALVESRVAQVVRHADWSAIDQAERSAGMAAGRPRQKMVMTEQLLRTVRAAQDAQFTTVPRSVPGVGSF
jgi:ferredoxin--NADP+ reductase